jgi:UDP-glucose 4-epimerase
LVAGHKTIVHFASIVGVEKTITEPVATVENLQGTLNITRHVTPDHSILFSSSADVYGVHSHVHDGPMSEDDLQVFEHSAINRWVYPKVKSLEENIVANSPARSAVARIFNSYGPGMDFPHGKRVVPQFIDRIRNNQPIQISGDGQQLRSLCYYEDTVRGCLEALLHAQKAPAGEVLTVNIGSDNAVSVVEIARQLVRHALDLGLIEDPPPFEFGAQLYSQPFDDSWSRTPDLSRACSILGFEPRIGLDDGIRRTLLYYRPAFTAVTEPYTSAHLEAEPVVCTS